MTFILTVLASVWTTGFVFYLIFLNDDFEGWRRAVAAALWPYLVVWGWLWS